MNPGDVCLSGTALALFGAVLTPLLATIGVLFKQGEARRDTELGNWKALYYEAKGVSREGVSTVREIVRMGK